jgi:hypothetical protein
MDSTEAERLVRLVVERARVRGHNGKEATPGTAAHIVPNPDSLPAEVLAALKAALGTASSPADPVLYGKIWLDVDPEDGVRLRAAHEGALPDLKQPPKGLRPDPPRPDEEPDAARAQKDMVERKTNDWRKNKKDREPKAKSAEDTIIDCAVEAWKGLVAPK